jgi:2-aminoadipate transaminase
MRNASYNKKTIQLAEWTQGIERSQLQKLLPRANQAGIISLALGLPDPDLFPTAALARACEYVLCSERDALQYAPPSETLKQQIVNLMACRGVACTTSQIFITSGAQQGISLLSRILLGPQNVVFVEEFSYPGFIQAVSLHRPQLVTIKSSTTDGIDIDDLESKLKQGLKPDFLYVIPEGHNPQGSSMGADKKYQLANIAARWGFAVIEDDAYGFLQYDGAQRPALRAINDSNILYVGSFAKILAPSLRVGWLVVPEYMVQSLSVLKESTDIEIRTYSQRVVEVYLDTNDLQCHIEQVRFTYEAKRNLMVKSLQDMIGDELAFKVPPAGLFIWGSLNSLQDTTKLLESALSHQKVAFLPGEAFSTVRSDNNNYLRLNFSHSGIAAIPEGIRRLARAIFD